MLGPPKQGDAECIFKLLDLSRQRRLGNMRALGCPTEMKLLGNGEEVAQLTKFHLSILPYK
jgi:hypothetical protein